jgi:hypothetical protein
MAGNLDPDLLTRQPREPSVGPSLIEPEQISPEDAVAEAKENLARETARREAAERSAEEERRGRQQAEARATEAGGAAWSAQERQIESQLATEQQRMDRAQEAMTAAFNAADGAALAKAQREMSLASAAADRLSGQKQWFESERLRVQEEAKRAPPLQQQPGGLQVATPGGNMTVQPQAKEWMDKHSRFYSDKGYYNFAVEAHRIAMEDGIREGSPAYFRHLDAAMADYEGYEAHREGRTGGTDPMPDNISQRQQQRRQPSAASVGAPVSRATAAPRSRDGGVPSWQEVARHVNRQGGDVNEADLRQMAQVNGYKGEAGFQAYLTAQGEIIALNRQGDSAGLVTDQNYR